ncbi:hypothetical protein J3R30DRAFT_3409949 [Lentinula aciculospora]|uniref:Uncharacterized protein n=1 Tax=Lentinula aciculospora TaxID=153920 RepID=A0A9W9DG17_9AGAR|nr:hypothetical protein J3R30DRAFT_3409949 [Lentinula aciculospora]
MSIVVLSTVIPALGSLVPPLFHSTLDIIAQVNFYQVTALSHKLEMEDVKSVHHNPETGEVKAILERRTAEGRRDTNFVSKESLQRVGLRIVKNLMDTNPPLYPGTSSEVFETYYSTQYLLSDLMYWMAQCQIKASNLEAQGIQSGWNWNSALTAKNSGISWDA